MGCERALRSAPFVAKIPRLEGGGGGLERPLRGFTWARDVTFQFVIFPPSENFPPASKRGLFVFVPSRICLAIHPSIEGKKKMDEIRSDRRHAYRAFNESFFEQPFPGRNSFGNGLAARFVRGRCSTG